MKILMVCLGNICRSPLAQGILESKCKKHGLDWTVDSAGTGAWHIGKAPDPRSIDTGLQHGIDITNQRARQLKQSDFYTFDLILTMDDSNFRDVIDLLPKDVDLGMVKNILDYNKLRKGQIVPDPYYDGKFIEVFLLLDEIMDSVIEAYK